MEQADMSQLAQVSSSEPAKTKEIYLLALDGGGVRWLSSLLILKQLMGRIDPINPPKPCAIFDMIGGTSTGGLIAIMLGRLGMSVDECIEVYKVLSPKIFTKVNHRINIKGKIQGRFDHEALEAGVKAILANRGLNEDELLNQNDTCKTFVCATSQMTGSTVVLSTYYSSRRGNDMWDRVKIWQAVRATSAASSFFDPIVIDGEGFVDGATGANNPIKELWAEASDVWREGINWRLEDNVKCLVSIGTGIPTLKPFTDNFIDIGNALVAIATDTEDVANMFQRDHTNLYRERRAFRFNAIQGLEDIGLEEAKREGEIMAATRRYIESENVFTAMEECIEKLRQYDPRCTPNAKLPEEFLIGDTRNADNVNSLRAMSCNTRLISRESLWDWYLLPILKKYNAEMEVICDRPQCFVEVRPPGLNWSWTCNWSIGKKANRTYDWRQWGNNSWFYSSFEGENPDKTRRIKDELIDPYEHKCRTFTTDYCKGRSKSWCDTEVSFQPGTGDFTMKGESGLHFWMEVHDWRQVTECDELRYTCRWQIDFKVNRSKDRGLEIHVKAREHSVSEGSENKFELSGYKRVSRNTSLKPELEHARSYFKESLASLSSLEVRLTKELNHQSKIFSSADLCENPTFSQYGDFL